MICNFTGGQTAFGKEGFFRKQPAGCSCLFHDGRWRSAEELSQKYGPFQTRLPDIIVLEEESAPKVLPSLISSSIPSVSNFATGMNQFVLDKFSSEYYETQLVTKWLCLLKHLFYQPQPRLLNVKSRTAQTLPILTGTE